MLEQRLIRSVGEVAMQATFNNGAFEIPLDQDQYDSEFGDGTEPPKANVRRAIISRPSKDRGDDEVLSADRHRRRSAFTAEEEALKAKISKIYVTDPKRRRRQPTCPDPLGYPMAEVNRQYRSSRSILHRHRVRRRPPTWPRCRDRLLAQRVRHLR
jgi:hypothetical protein